MGREVSGAQRRGGRTTSVVATLVAVLVVVAGGCAKGDAGTAASTGPPGAGAAGSAADGADASAGEDSSTDRAVPSAGCDSPTGAPAVTQRTTIDVDGTQRWYLVTAPEQATGADPVPMVLDFHGLSEGAEFHSQSTGWSELAEEEGFVAVFPNGAGRIAAWNIASSGPNPDLDYIDAVLGEMEQQYCIDTSRVYATGLSNGAFMSSVLGCTRSSVFAAVAPVAGVTHPPDCAPDRPVPVLAFHGTADPLLPFNGAVSGDAISGLVSGTGVTTTTSPPADLDGEGYPANVAAWAAANGCGEPSDQQVTTSVLRRTWDCPDGGEVEFYVVDGGGHTWPGSDALTGEGIVEVVGPTTFEIDATELAWEFFQSHRLDA